MIYAYNVIMSSIARLFKVLDVAGATAEIGVLEAQAEVQQWAKLNAEGRTERFKTAQKTRAKARKEAAKLAAAAA